jgi:hypothetical protein
MSLSPSFFVDLMLAQSNAISTSFDSLGEGMEAQLNSSSVGEEETQFSTASQGGGISATNYSSPSAPNLGFSSTESFGSQLSDSMNNLGSFQSASGVNSFVSTREYPEEGNSQFSMTSAFTNQERSIGEWNFGHEAANPVFGYGMTSVPLNTPVQTSTNLGITSDYR